MRISIVIILLSLATLTHGQPYYFTQRTETYTELNGASSLDNGITWGGALGVTIPIGFNYDFMGATFSQLRVETTGRLVFDPANHFFFADGFAAVGIQDRGYTNNIARSPRSYKVEGMAGNRILKIQFKNAGCAFDTSKYLNFQLWLYEANGDFELHMGSSNVMTSSLFTLGPLSGVHHLKTITPLDYDYGLIVYGDVNNLNDSTLSSSGLVFDNYELNRAPIEHTVYKYSTTPHTSLKVMEGRTSFGVYPTVCNNVLYANSSKVKKVLVYNMLGVLVKKSELYPLTISDLSSGSYLIKTIGSNCVVYVDKVFKQ